MNHPENVMEKKRTNTRRKEFKATELRSRQTTNGPEKKRVWILMNGRDFLGTWWTRLNTISMMISCYSISKESALTPHTLTIVPLFFFLTGNLSRYTGNNFSVSGLWLVCRSVSVFDVILNSVMGDCWLQSCFTLVAFKQREVFPCPIRPQSARVECVSWCARTTHANGCEEWAETGDGVLLFVLALKQYS